MLNSAFNMALITAEMQKNTADENRKLIENDAALAIRNTELERHHLAFHEKALSTARNGKLNLILAGHEISMPRLISEGFSVRQLIRRAKFEEHLRDLCKASKKELVRTCDFITRNFEGVILFDGEECVSHRNPLVSLLEDQWKRKKNSDLIDVDLILSFENLHRSGVEIEIKLARTHLQKALNVLYDLKQAESKYQSVSDDNALIPAGCDTATFVSWEDADDGGGLKEIFSAEYLKWLVISWPAASEVVGEMIEDAAKGGKNSIDLFIYKSDDEWRISGLINPYLTDSSNESDHQIKWDLDSEDFFSFCAPNVAAAELKNLGYVTSSEIFSMLNSDRCGDADQQKTSIACQMRIEWKIS